MSKRYARSGNSDEALTTPAVDCRELLNGGIHTGRVFWARAIWVTNSHATDTSLVQIYDQAEGVAVAANERASFYVPAQTTVIFEFPTPGSQFFTNLVAAVTSGTVAVYQAGCNGYEEGQG